MSKDRDDVANLFDKTGSEQEVIDRLATGMPRLQVIQATKQMLAEPGATAHRRAVARRRAVLKVSA